jgi:hypothetical protein
VTDAQIEQLLKLVSTKSEKLWHEDIAFRLVWRSKYDRMVSHHVERITEVVDKWMATAAGEWFVEKRKVGQKRARACYVQTPSSIFASVFILFRPSLPPPRTPVSGSNERPERNGWRLGPHQFCSSQHRVSDI